MTTLLICALLCGIGLVLFGIFYVFAQGMSDSPGTSDPRGGCVAAVVGAVMFIAALVTLIVRAF
jgi:hypothetical protein